jgi:PEP-CTERM motif
MIKRLIFVFVLSGMLMVVKADQAIVGHGTTGNAAWNVNANGNDSWHSSSTFDRGFVVVADGTTTKGNHAFLGLDADHATGNWARETNPGNHGDFQILHDTDWGAGAMHYDWGHHKDHDGDQSGSLGSTGPVASPEPGTVILLGAGLLGFALLKLRK